MKLTVVFAGCGQVGVDTYADYFKTRIINFTEEQINLLTPPKGMEICNVIFERYEEETND